MAQLTRATPGHYLLALQALQPSGLLWAGLCADPVWRSLLLAFADSLARAHNRIADLLAEADPRTTAEMLPEWERCVGLPDRCITSRALSTQERRDAVVSRVVASGGAWAAYFIGVAAMFGYTATVKETAPHQWRLNSVEAVNITYFRAGESAAGDSLGEFGNEQFECLMNRLKPAHTQLLFAYGV